MRAVQRWFTGLLLVSFLGCGNDDSTVTKKAEPPRETKPSIEASQADSSSPVTSPEASDVKKTESDSAPPEGAISGRIVLKGEVPPKEIAIKKGAAIKDAEVCAAIDLYKEDLIVNPDNNGIANVFIFMKTKPEGVKFDPPAQEKLLVDQKNCRFIPHAMIVQTDQVVEVISSDNCAHNLHTNPIRGAAMNVLMAANTPEGKGVVVAFNGPEIVPIKINCDIHTWMAARWLIVDHPYAGMTNEKGEFTIDTAGLPDGEYEFRINHERSGWLENSLMVNVKDGAADLGTMEYELSKFAEE